MLIATAQLFLFLENDGILKQVVALMNTHGDQRSLHAEHGGTRPYRNLLRWVVSFGKLRGRGGLGERREGNLPVTGA